MRLVFAVQFAPGLTPVPVTVKTSWLPRLFGKDGTTIGRTVRTTLRDAVTNPELHAPFLRHEFRHVDQQRHLFLPWWLLQYVVSPTFRRAMEADAREAEQAAYPQWIADA